MSVLSCFFNFLIICLYISFDKFQGVVCFRVQWNALPESVVSLQDLEAFKVTVSKLQHSRP